MVQVLVAAMHEKDHSLLERMNIQSDVIVGNQCDRNEIEKFDYEGHQAVYLNFSERGVGLNRNNALMRATGEFCLFADDDMTYVDGYPEIVEKAFLENPDADIILFNLGEASTSGEKRYVIPKPHKVGWLNYLRYGTPRVAFRLQSVKRRGIYFNECFGGGTEHCHGEDNLFLTECLRKKLKLVAVPVEIASLREERESTWNTGYDEKYLKDQGILYRTISPSLWKLLCLQDAYRHRHSYQRSVRESMRLMTGG